MLISGLGGMRMSHHLPLSLMNRLIQTESAVFKFPKDPFFDYFEILENVPLNLKERVKCGKIRKQEHTYCFNFLHMFQL